MTPLPDLARDDTFPKLLARNAAEHGDAVAMREKDFGIWNPITWATYQERVRAIAMGLLGLGVERGAVVGLLGKNRPNWVFAEVAAHAVGGMTLGIYQDVIDEEAAYLIDYAGVAVVFAEDEEQVDKLLGLGDRIPTVRWILYNDPRGMRKYDDSRLLALADLERRGSERDSAEPGRYEAEVAKGRGGDVAILCTTSGTTAHPKLAMLQAGPFLGHCAAYLDADPKGPDDEYVSVLPLPWIMEQVYAVAQPLLCRIRVNFVEETETMMADMREIAPTFVLFAPRVWESIAADVRARIMDASPLKRAAFDVGMKLGLAALDQGRRSPLADMLLFRALRDRLGFTRLKSAATGGAALGPDTFRFFLALGVPLRQLYGQTELAGAYTVHRPDDVDFETVGVPFANTEVRIDDPDANGLGQIVTRHTGMFAGYWRNEEATAKTMTGDWVLTGDAGYFDDRGHLVVIDRMADLAETARGDRFSPQYLENKLKFSTFVGEAVVLGHQRPFLAAMLCIRYSIVSKWAEKNRITFTTYTDLASRAEVYELVRAELVKVNEGLPESQRIRRFVLLYKELDPDDGELTRTRKVRREVVNTRYAEIIDAIYAGRDTVHVDTTITFQDGTKQRIRTDLRIVDLVGEAEARAAA